MKVKMIFAISLILLVGLLPLLSACTPKEAPTPEIIKETVVVTEEIEKVVTATSLPVVPPLSL